MYSLVLMSCVSVTHAKLCSHVSDHSDGCKVGAEVVEGVGYLSLV